MADDILSATRVIDASPEAVFAVLVDPSKHAAIDGTGWVCETLDSEPLTTVGQIFRLSMYHPNHPDGHYEMANLVKAFEPPYVIAWQPGYEADGTLQFGGWIWRYDLTPMGPAKSSITLSYDWSAVPDAIREHIGFPPFPRGHLDNSLAHLAELVR